MSVPCKEWDGTTNADGYGVIGGGATQRYAHRVAWEQEHGVIPDTLVIDHMCENKACVEVRHMHLVTRGENVRLSHRRKKACKRGHAWTEDNTYWLPAGTRQCRTCRKLRKEGLRAV